MKVNILGTPYKIDFRTNTQDSKLKLCDGYCDYSIKQIVCLKRTDKDKTELDLQNLKTIERRLLRHEIIHAFIYESGLWTDSFNTQSWAMNEEMTDWIALQFPKIYKVYKQLNILD